MSILRNDLIHWPGGFGCPRNRQTFVTNEPQGRLPLENLRPGLNIGSLRQAVDQAGEVGDTTNPFEFIMAFQFVADSDHVGRTASVWGRLEEALALLKKQEAICLELGNKGNLGYCYWNWGLVAQAQGDKQTEKQKLQQALALFTELNMPRERDAVQAEVEEASST